MTRPIPIKFTRQPPDCEGLYLNRQSEHSTPDCLCVRLWFDRLRVRVGQKIKAVSEIGGEWAGPLQIVNENEAGEHQEGKEGT